jgi:ferrous iron transport protein B
VDLPGTYSVLSDSAEEKAARDFIASGHFDAVIVVADAACLERNLILVLQMMEIGKPTALCLNLMDEAQRKGYEIDVPLLAQALDIPVVATNARSGAGLEQLKDQIERMLETGAPRRDSGPVPDMNEAAGADEEARIASVMKKAERIASQTVRVKKENPDAFSRKIDRILTSKVYGLPIMAVFLAGIFWLTISGSNKPSQLLALMFQGLEIRLGVFLYAFGIPLWLHDALVHGMFRTLGWVISVMFPPMALFFPLFTFLEDLGFLPRVAFNLDHYFKGAHTCGKQALTMCMGFGCNAVGVSGCRIIHAPRERLIAMITNTFAPCNGRFPGLIMLSGLLFSGVPSWAGSLLAAAGVIFLVMLGVAATLLISRLLSNTWLKGDASMFALELPPYRRPRIGRIILYSLLNRTLFVLGRAVAAAAPAGLVIWLMANTYLGHESLLAVCAGFFQPFAHWMGVDGYILLAFVLGAPANEIVLPILMMGYLSQGSLVELEGVQSIGRLLADHGWTWLTAVNVMVFSLMHFPCATTLWTIRKETRSWKWTGVSFLIPTAAGTVLCVLITWIARLFGLDSFVL